MATLFILAENTTSLSNNLGCIVDGKNDFIESIENQLSVTKSKYKYNSRYFDELDISIYCYNLNSNDYHVNIAIELNMKDEFKPPKNWYDLYAKDEILHKFILEKLIEFTKEFNSNINFYFPQLEDFIFKYNTYYIESNAYSSDKKVKWLPFALGEDESDFTDTYTYDVILK